MPMCVTQKERDMKTIDTLYATVNQAYEHLYDVITALASHPDDEDLNMLEGIAHRDYDDAYRDYMMALFKAQQEADSRGELPF